MCGHMLRVRVSPARGDPQGGREMKHDGTGDFGRDHDGLCSAGKVMSGGGRSVLRVISDNQSRAATLRLREAPR